VARAFTVLDRLSRERALSLERLSREVHLAKATTHRFLLTLQTLGYVRRDEHDHWALTLKLFNTGARALDHLDLYAVAKPIAEELAEEIGETVHMGVLENGAAVYVLKNESRHTIRMYSRVGRSVPLYCTALGKVLLAHADLAVRAAVLGSMRLVRHTPRTLTSRLALEAEFDKVRRQGFAMDNEEHEPGIRCIGAPVFAHGGAVVAALSASWPTFRFPADAVDRATEAVKSAARRISARLGGADEQ
jgi:IclR family KDG regulon transcriptional repressor